MMRRPALALPFALAVLALSPGLAFAQDGGGRKPEEPAGGPAPAAAPVEKPKAEEAPPEVKGNRFRVKLKRGSQIEGVLPQGVVWEKRDQMGEYIEAAETEKGAGLRLHYVLNLEGDIFVLKADIEEIKDLGALTDEDKLLIQRQVLTTRKKALEEREKALRAEMEKLAAAGREQQEEDAKAGNKKPGPGDKKGGKEALERKKGDELLKKFPPPDWGEKKVEDVLRREVINGIFRSDEEKEFIDNIKLWQDALARQTKAEAAKKEGGGDEGGAGGGDAGGEGGGDEGSGDSGTKKENPPAGGPPPAPEKKKKGGK
jgi:hypothetical protein